ncbi:MAG: NAD-dependent succinate-semialdehyde dehydrogenase [Tistrella sp.]|uniref:NAD-dependent succinate-semialdehyde dehydrogenase n=1 Tax=Tistrella mobilis TaxID=171437 RepID=A0A3B9IDZ6_9PROT|nr:NAD-dependent succinate-semialdehyde dehydrogenase [Tistrella sp.]MAD37381.1 NAD-dependent succinate-semialdehyde dehydrogenase [Tistrella sp.]MBA78037.1 NAD-dependent succinate-semialdehyde dehydrogenase [Tistrella sp.]HAE45918.1 NAD-dependent succinate-semialdehyde dehydrogenase [Tistrella mobilis]
MYPNTSLFIDGTWAPGSTGKDEAVLNPATAEEIGRVAHASTGDLDRALEAAARAFRTWRKVSPYDRSKVMRKAADLLRERADTIARIMTMEQGKPLAEAKVETLAAADLIDWFAEEGRRTYGRVIPSRAVGHLQTVTREPVGVVAAFTPWNFPINQVVRKVSAAVATGCTIIVKGPEETPASCAELIRAYADAGVPAGVINLVYGIPAEVSSYLIPHPVIAKISFTGSTAVGKHLAAMAGQHMKRATMELGGHAPAIVFGDVDVSKAAKALAAQKFRNAGQVCVSPTRFLVEESVADRFVGEFTEAVASIKVGDGLDPETRMGPLANSRRVDAMEALVADAVANGATIRTGGERIGNKGYFFQPTVMTGVPLSARIMNEEPFGPVVPVSTFSGYDALIAEANRLPYGLAAYAYTSSSKTAAALSADIESGMISINQGMLALPEVPFGGIKDSGYGSEGGIEAMEPYLITKFTAHNTTF